MRFWSELAGHLRLTWRLFWDTRVGWWCRIIFVVPVLYFLVPFRYDLLVDLAPLVGLLDDWLLLMLWSYVFVAICPRSTVHEHRATILLSHPDPVVRAQARADRALLNGLSAVDRMEIHRHPREALGLLVSLAILLAISIVGGVVAVAVFGVLVGVSHTLVRLTQAQTARTAIPAGGGASSQVEAALDRCFSVVPRVHVNVWVTEARSLRTHAFGLDQPYELVVASRAAEDLQPDELAVLCAHELGHMLFEHTFLSSVFGGVLDRLSIAGSLWALVFALWRRFAEYTADRVALLVCDDVNTVARTIIKLSWGVTDQEVDVKAALRYACSEGPQTPSSRVEELLQSHPPLAARLRALAAYDAELFASEVEAWLATDSTE